MSDAAGRDRTAGRPKAGRLAELAAARGELTAGGGNQLVHLSEPETLWFVAEGSVDVFSALLRDDGAPVDFKHLLRADSGRLLFCAAPDVGRSVLVARGLPDSALRRLPSGALAGADIDEELARQAEAWISDVSEAVAREVTYRPRIDRLIAAGHQEEIEAGQTLSARHGVVWVSSEEAPLAYLSTEELDRADPDAAPVTPASWIDASRAGRVRCDATLDLQGQGRLLAALARFNELALNADDLNRRLLVADVANLQTASALHRQRSERSARRRLLGVLSGGRQAEEGPSVPVALQQVGAYEGISFRMPQSPSRRAESPDAGPSLADILVASGVRARRVALRPDQRWWLGDSGAMLGVRRDDGVLVALIPGPLGRYRILEPESGRSRHVSARRAALLERDAFFFYRPLPDDRSVGGRQLLRLALHRGGRDLVRMVLTGLLAAAAMLAPAALLGAVAGHALPSGSLRTLGTVTAVGVLVALTFGLLQTLKGTALMRLEGRAAARAGAALLNRMLDLPSAFFRRFAAGDLATRAMAFHQLRDEVAGVVAEALLSVVFLLPTFVFLYLYNATLGWLCLGMGVVSLGVTLTLGLIQTPHHRQRLTVTRRLAGTLLQLIGGVGKLRSTGSEGTAFALWAEGYREQKEAEMRLGRVNEHLIAFTTSAPLFASAALFAVALGVGADRLPVSNFLVVYAAFMVFQGAVAQLGFSFSAIAAILPAGEQVMPILEEKPRTVSSNLATPQLKGEVFLDHVSFQYSDTGPLILEDVSIHARPGEFIALVGESGAGKSTVFRLALGLEAPLSGSVFYDGHDLSRLNWKSLRKEIGVVVQDAAMHPETVLDNIVGMDGDLTLDDAWQAARSASVDAEINAMPMGMHTVTSGATAAFSGGQAQRIMIASALVRNPSVLLLDEATNWLDNRAQAAVMDQIENLAVTRIVSAHRLSTIRRADRIYVLEGGRVVQEGTFAELMDDQGVFRNLARRQLA